MDKKYLIAAIVVIVIFVVIYGATAKATTVKKEIIGPGGEKTGGVGESILKAALTWLTGKP